MKRILLFQLTQFSGPAQSLLGGTETGPLSMWDEMLNAILHKAVRRHIKLLQIYCNGWLRGFDKPFLRILSLHKTIVYNAKLRKYCFAFF